MSDTVATKSATISNTAKAIGHADFGWGAQDLAKANAAWISASQGVRYTFDGATDPTATLGHPIAADGTNYIPDARLVRDLRFIRTGGSDAVVTISLLKD